MSDSRAGLRLRLPTTKWTVFYALLSLVCGVVFVWGFFRGWPTRSLLALAFISLYMDPTDSLILRILQRNNL